MEKRNPGPAETSVGEYLAKNRKRTPELDAIAAVVIGGTLLTGGYGFVAGTFIGVMLQGLGRRGVDAIAV